MCQLQWQQCGRASSHVEPFSAAGQQVRAVPSTLSEPLTAGAVEQHVLCIGGGLWFASGAAQRMLMPCALWAMCSYCLVLSANAAVISAILHFPVANFHQNQQWCMCNMRFCAHNEALG